MNWEKKTSKGWRVGDRVAYSCWFAGRVTGAVIVEVVEGDNCRLRFDDDSVGVFPMHTRDGLNWRRLRSKKITFRKENSK